MVTLLFNRLSLRTEMDDSCPDVAVFHLNLNANIFNLIVKGPRRVRILHDIMVKNLVPHPFNDSVVLRGDSNVLRNDKATFLCQILYGQFGYMKAFYSARP